MPDTSNLEKLSTTLQDLLHVIKNPKPKSPFLDFGNEQTTALQQLAEIFHKSLHNQPLESNSPPTVNDAAPAPRVPTSQAQRVADPTLPRVQTQNNSSSS